MGGAGAYAYWLTDEGYTVHLVDAVPLHVEQARAAANGYTVELGDARSLHEPDASADAVLLLGPLYHLTERADRLRALAEAGRVLRPGGHIFVAAISRFASLLDGLRENRLDDPAYVGGMLGVSVEGPGWILPEFDARWRDDRWRHELLAALARIEREPSMLGVSAHLLAVARRPVSLIEEHGDDTHDDSG